MKAMQLILLLSIATLFACNSKQPHHLVIDESHIKASVEQVIFIDSVWSGHPVGFCLYTHKKRQYIAYYNANRNMVVGQRELLDENFELHIMPTTSREKAQGTSTVLGWDSHNYLTIGIDSDDYIHLSGNVHVHPLTYFRSSKPNDISSLEQVFEMVGRQEQETTYPRFMLNKEGDLLYHYRDGGSGDGNEIYNIYNTQTKIWKRLLDTPFTDGQGLMNAYQTQPTLMKDGWYHVYWVWRDTPDCATNHDLSYMKSPDLEIWFDAFGEPVELPATLDQKSLIVDPIPVNGGIINLAAKLVLDEENKPVFVYHKYDDAGNLQFYIARIQDKEWTYQQITDWDYRWEFSGGGSIGVEVSIRSFGIRPDGNYEIDYWHIQYGKGTMLLNDEFEVIGKVTKPENKGGYMEIEGSFPGLGVRTSGDLGRAENEKYSYILKWETLGSHRDRPREKPWPGASRLLLYKLKKAE